MYAIVKHGARQYKVRVGDELRLDRFAAEAKSRVELGQVLALGGKGGEGLRVGSPLIEGARVIGEVVNQGRDKKIIIFKKRRRKDSKLKRGFRRDFTRVLIKEIIA